MKILIILFCLVLLFRHSREPFLGKLKKGISNVTQTINQNVLQPIHRNVLQPVQQHVLQPIKQNTYDPMRDFFLDLLRKKKEAEELLKKKQDCAKKLTELTSILNELSQWNAKINEYRNNPKYFDRNFNKEIFSFYKNDLTILNTIIDENTELNQDLFSLLTKIEILQNDNKLKIDDLNNKNTELKECDMNKELTFHDYEVLK